jgi:2-amino-4-hydroxy-6-hydroxymethyldihydropteridine diphosphokinase
MENLSFIGIGSNLESRLTFIQKALDLLEEDSNINILKFSSIYETKPYGYTDQDNFLNCVVKISTKYSLIELFNKTKSIELEIGRVKREKWGPREIDLDILFFNDVVYCDEKLNIPHRDVLYRDFVLVPLLEIEPDIFHPVEQKKISEIEIKNLEVNIIRKLDYLKV